MKLVRSEILWAAAFATALFAASPAFAAPAVTLTSPATVSPGGSLQLTVNASDFSDLYAYQFDVTFDASAFSAASVLEGSFLSTGGSTFFDGGTIDNTGGTVTFVLNTLIGPGSGVNGSGSLAQLNFTVGSAFAGTGSFGIANLVALDSALNPINVAVQGISVTAVPEPSALALSLAGLGLFAGLTLKRSARRESVAHG